MKVEEWGSAPLPPATEVETSLSALEDVEEPPTEDAMGLGDIEPAVKGATPCVVGVVGRLGTAAEELPLIAEADKVTPSADVDASVWPTVEMSDTESVEELREE